MKRILLLMTMVLVSAETFAKEIPAGFKQEKVEINGINYNVYKGGHGDPLVLLHGYAQSALMWTPVMNALKDQYTIIVPDLRGIGLTDAPDKGYDKVTIAEDVKKLLEHYDIPAARVVGHDLGLMVAYALAAKHPDSVKKLVVMDAFLPGIGPGDDIYNSPDIWHFRFHGPFAEKLVAGRELIHLDAVWTPFSADPKTFPMEDKKYYAKQYARPGRMRAGFAWFSAMPQDAKDNRELVKTKLKMPVLAMGGDHSLGGPLIETMKAAAENVQGVVVKDCGHWMTEECPKPTLEALRSFLKD
jgi:pimeloyl-ACP methyl ester carboxylesterase